ncbi:DUF523 domain-containing protein [Lysinibacillus sp. LZ02]|uniref:DUF523 domain-containing protein n=1 Tax=Lysinibacillus sp. LZ02 TaxID=3420668 RepID=UPI003D365059
MIVISSCLAGMKVRYDGNANTVEKIRQLVEEKKAVTVCPEVLGGLPTPRNPAEIIGGDGEAVLDGVARVVDNTGEDVTDAFLQGAYKALEVVQQVGAHTVVLKENSPSCGSNHIYTGEFNGTKKQGAGVTAALLRRHGIHVVSEENFLHYIEEIR